MAFEVIGRCRGLQISTHYIFKVEAARDVILADFTFFSNFGASKLTITFFNTVIIQHGR